MRKQSIKIKTAYVLDIVKRFKCDESGSTAIEYGLVASLVSLLLITGANALGGSVSQTFTEISLLLSGPVESPPASVFFGG